MGKGKSRGSLGRRSCLDPSHSLDTLSCPMRGIPKDGKKYSIYYPLWTQWGHGPVSPKPLPFPQAIPPLGKGGNRARKPGRCSRHHRFKGNLFFQTRAERFLDVDKGDNGEKNSHAIINFWMKNEEALKEAMVEAAFRNS
jgi:hypothetical protein